MTDFQRISYDSLLFTWITIMHLEPVCCKKQQKSSWPVTGLRDRGPLKDLNDSKLIVYESKWFPWSSRINFIPFRIFWGPLFHKPVTAGTFFATLYNIMALIFSFSCEIAYLWHLHSFIGIGKLCWYPTWLLEKQSYLFIHFLKCMKTLTSD